MGDLRPNPGVVNTIWASKQKGNVPKALGLFGDVLRKGASSRGVVTELGKRNGIPLNQDQDYYFWQKKQLHPYEHGMHPYKSNRVVDVSPSVYNTNPIAGTGGYEKNLASYNGTRPLATALDEPQEFAQRLYEDEFRLAANNPLSAKFTVAARQGDYAKHGDMYDAYRIGKQGDQDSDIVMKSKLEKGYGGVGQDLYGNRNPLQPEFTEYLKRQQPANSQDMTTVATSIKDLATKTVTPAAFDDLKTQLSNASTKAEQDRNEHLNEFKLHGATLRGINRSGTELVNYFNQLGGPPQAQQAQPLSQSPLDTSMQSVTFTPMTPQQQASPMTPLTKPGPNSKSSGRRESVSTMANPYSGQKATRGPGSREGIPLNLLSPKGSGTTPVAARTRSKTNK